MIYRYITENSIYDVDMDKRTYRRKPIIQQGVHSTKLIYDEWMPLKDIEEPVKLMPDMRLHIMHEDSVKGIITSRVESVQELEDV